VWIGDASACPTSLGANPMITIMALAERTADKMAASSRQDFSVIPSMAGNMARGFDAVPRMAGNMIREMASLMTNPAGMFREMVGIMTNPLNMFALGERLLLGRPGTGSVTIAGDAVTQPKPAELPMYSHIIELTAKPGQAKALVNALRDQAIPQIIRHSEGFVDEIVLLSDTDPNHVTAISFWRSKQDGEHFYATGFAQVSALLQPFLNTLPERHEFIVGVSTNNRIVGWRS
jgi:quinol monooxygenase YgiN